VNALENWFCSTSFWRWMTQQKLLPWLLADMDLGDHVLELGSGPGAATDELLRRAPRVTSLEYSHAFTASLAGRLNGTHPASPHTWAILQGDASALPFRPSTFSSVIAVLMLHHLRSAELQGRAFNEIARVLRPGGTFVAFEIRDSWFNRVIHRKSTFVPVRPDSLSTRMVDIGFTQVKIESRDGAFRFYARRAL
jgi:SAM-dependent methyltransferase